MSTIEKPGNGRAVITESFKQIQVEIPAKKNLFLLLAPLGYLVVLWVMWGKVLISITSGDKTRLNYSQWPILLFAIFGVLSLLNQLWWTLLGKEIITAGNGELTIRKKARLLAFTKNYNLNAARLFRAEYRNEYEGDDTERFAQRISNIGNSGTICFEYGAKTVRFGEELSEAEGNYILQLMKANGVLTDTNFI